MKSEYSAGLAMKVTPAQKRQDEVRAANYAYIARLKQEKSDRRERVISRFFAVVTLIVIGMIVMMALKQWVY